MESSEIIRRLTAEFDANEIKWKPAMVKGDRCLALCYLDARAIMDRLDSVVGVMGWKDAYRILDDGCVVCKLSIQIGDKWITKSDVGSPSEQGDFGDRRKAAFSDALKRAAVKFGIGRYLYSMPSQWVDYDAQKKRMVRTPVIPSRFADAGRLVAIHGRLQRAGKSWKAALSHFGVALPAEFQEPRDEQEAIQLRELVPVTVVESLSSLFK